MEVGLLCVCFLIGSIIYFFFPTGQLKGKKIPGPKGWPFVGIMFSVSQDTIHHQLHGFAKKYGEIMKIKMMGSDIVLLNSEPLIRKAFAESDARFSLNDRPETFIGSMFYPNEGSLVLCKNAYTHRHDTLRKLFTKGFHVYGDGVEDFEKKVQNAIQSLMLKLQELDGEDLEVVSAIKNSTVNLISVFLCGSEIGDDVKLMTEQFLEGGNNLLSPTVNNVLLHAPFLRYFPGYREIVDHFSESREKLFEYFLFRQKETYEPAVVRGFVDFYLTEQRKAEAKGEADLSSDDLCIGVINDILGAGIVTTTVSLSCTILLLTEYPEVQKKARQEIYDVIGRGRLPTIEDKPRCPYIEALFLEVQRYTTVVPLGGIHFSRTDVNLGDYFIPKNTMVLPNIWHVHHDEMIWGDPWIFRPDRFLDEKGQLLPRTHLHRKSMLPFGVGRRQCIGEQFGRSRVFLYITTLLQRWTIQKSCDFPDSCDPRDGHFTNKFTLTPKPFWCKFVENIE